MSFPPCTPHSAPPCTTLCQSQVGTSDDDAVAAVFSADSATYLAALPKLPIPGQRNILVRTGVAWGFERCSCTLRVWTRKKTTHKSRGSGGVRTTPSHAGGPVALACKQRLLSGMVQQPRPPCVNADSHSPFL